MRDGRYGPYVTEVLPEGTDGKPRTASLLESMSPDTVTLEDALRLLSLPRVVGVDPDGEEITAQLGRYGPYVKKGSESRSLESRGAGVHGHARRGDRAPGRAEGNGRRRGRRRAAAQGARRRSGSGKPIVVKDGRFGPYVTDGETNARLRSGDTTEAITLERAVELLAERRAKGPAKRKGRRTREAG